MLMMVFWVVIPCGLVGGYRCFRGIYCLYLYPEDEGKAIHSFKTLETTYKTIQCQNPEDPINIFFMRTSIKS
jgi:hypothetical protein